MNANFDASGTARNDAGIFGLPFAERDARLVIQPVPWEVTTSYGDGTSLGPQAILQESVQVDLFDLEFGKSYERGIFCREVPSAWLTTNNQLKIKAKAIRDELARTGELSPAHLEMQNEINHVSRDLNKWLFNETKQLLLRDKIPVVLGGDHSSPFGLMEAVGAHYNRKFALLHIDAHADLRQAYQGFEFSHASIMYNVMNSEFAPTKLVQVGIRDFCEEEFVLIQESKGKIETFFDWDLKKQSFAGRPWSETASQIIGRLPENVYVSFDIDGLDPAFCPNTGTPVPGGLSFDQAIYLLREIQTTGRKIIAFDLNEVSTGPDQSAKWDAVVGARLLYKMCGYTLA